MDYCAKLTKNIRLYAAYRVFLEERGIKDPCI